MAGLAGTAAPTAVFAMVSAPPHGDVADQPARLQSENRNNDDERHRELLAVADEIEAGRSLEDVAEIGDQVLQHAHDEAARHRPAGAGDAAHQRSGEAVE